MQDGIPAAVPADEAETAYHPGGAVAVSAEPPATLSDQVLEAARVAFTEGLQVVALVSAIIAALAAIAWRSSCGR